MKLKVRLRTIIIAAVAVILGGLITVPLVLIGPRNVWGMLRYDQRHEGALKVGDIAPGGDLIDLQSGQTVRLEQAMDGRPLVLIFGSYT